MKIVFKDTFIIRLENQLEYIIEVFGLVKYQKNQQTNPIC